MQALQKAEVLKRARAKRELHRRAGMLSLLLWVTFLNPSYDEPRHYREICEELDAMVVGKGEPRWLIFEAPPRHGKTDLILAAVARFLKRFPERLVAYMTHTDQQAKDVSRKAIKFAVRAGLAVGDDREIKDPLDPSKSARLWQTPQGGGFLALGKKGAITGKGIHWLIVDDPFKDREEAESPSAQKHVWDWWTGTAFDRVEPNGSVTVLHQRWNDGDLIQQIVNHWEKAKREGKPHRPWKRFTYPAWAEDAQGKPIQALWPERRSIADLQEIEAEIGPYNWLSKFMQRPERMRPGLLFKKQWFQLIDAIPAGGVWIRYWDRAGTDPSKGKFKSSDKADWTVGLLYGCPKWACVQGVWMPIPPFIVAHVERFREDPGGVYQRIMQTSALDAQRIGPGYIIGIEQDPGQAGKFEVEAYVSALSRYHVIPKVPTGSKATRAGPASAQGKAGNIWVLNAPWTPGFLDELEAFPSSTDHDDQVDGLSGAHAVLTSLPNDFIEGAVQEEGESRYNHLPPMR